MFSKFHRGHWEQERARCRMEPPELTPREAYGLWTWLRTNAPKDEPSNENCHEPAAPRDSRKPQQQLLAELLSSSGFDAIVEMAEDVDAISEWLPQRFRTEMRISVSELKAVELLKLVRDSIGALESDIDILDVIENGSEDVRHAQRLFAEVRLGGKKVWLLLENTADTEEDLYGPHHELLLKVSAGALDRRVERLQQLMSGWGQNKIQEGAKCLCVHLTVAAEALAWCRNRLDDIHEERPPRLSPGIGDGPIPLPDTAFSPRGRTCRPRRPGRQFFPLRHPARRCFTPSKDEGKNQFWHRPDTQPTLRLDTVIRRQDARPCDVGARVLEARNQERDTTCRCRWAEFQAERTHVTPVSKEPRFTRPKKAFVSLAHAKRPASSARRGALEDRPHSVAQMRC
ncbi:unnamed protein product [Symbiodinium natans]|uniref:Uncharacterized protein n=1 Tax=Symbiodinium natans TaxID=878477 RepID=A0A812Q7P4_9DINO|nr:unnamed protein product [Symbiodinium natans]